jgi:hypothetical protein
MAAMSVSPTNQPTSKTRRSGFEKPSAWVATVRRRDLRRAQQIGLSVDLPVDHGAQGDPRYPSPRRLRKVLSFVIDLVVHLSLATVIAATVAPHDPGRFLLFWLIGLIGVSIVDRILVQWASQATLGKALTGLRMIRDDTGGRPSWWLLTKAWLLGLIMILGSIF